MQCACVPLCCHICAVRFYRIFPQYPINGTIFERGGVGHIIEYNTCILIFSTFVCIFLIRTERDIIMNVNRFSFEVPVILARL